jgi:hypothetical protein
MKRAIEHGSALLQNPKFWSFLSIDCGNVEINDEMLIKQTNRSRKPEYARKPAYEDSVIGVQLLVMRLDKELILSCMVLKFPTALVPGGSSGVARTRRQGRAAVREL